MDLCGAQMEVVAHFDVLFLWSSGVGMLLCVMALCLRILVHVFQISNIA